MWLRVLIRNQTWDTLKEVHLAVSDRSARVLVTAPLDLHTTYEGGMRQQVAGNEGWHDAVAETILDASNDGLVVSISAPGCKPSACEIRREDIGSSYDPPRFQIGGHGTGYHVAAMHYRLSCSLDLDCDFAARAGDPPR
jgi:hypothetical protein